MQVFPFRPKACRPTGTLPGMNRRRAVSILRRWSSYDDETIAEAQQVIRATGWSCATSLLRGAIYGLAVMLAALVGLLGVARFLRTGI